MAYPRVKRIAEELTKRLSLEDRVPKIGIILGSGLGGFVEELENQRAVSYSEIEGFVQSTVEGHSGKFIVGEIDGVTTIAMQGRVHFYEGYSMEDVVLGVRVMALMGVEYLIVTNAAGGVNEAFSVGDIMVISDHINLLPNPLIGANDSRFGVRFPDMSEPYSRRLQSLVAGVAAEYGVELRSGVYLGSSGPTYETPAEYEYFHRIGADACGMSTTAEVIAARHMGVEVLGFSVITNVGRGASASKYNSHSDVVEASLLATQSLQRVVRGAIVSISKL